MALSWPITLLFRASGILRNFEYSASSTFWTGTPEIKEMTSAIESSSMTSACFFCSSSHASRAEAKSEQYFCSKSLNSLAALKSSRLTASIFFSWQSLTWASKSIISFGISTLRICALAPASSMASMALSGNCLSEIYLSDRFTHASMAASV